MFYADMMLFTVCVLHNTQRCENTSQKSKQSRTELFSLHTDVCFSALNNLSTLHLQGILFTASKCQGGLNALMLSLQVNGS